MRQIVALLLMAASGFAGLGYQIVWTQQSALWLGHETAAVLAVVAAFFGGLAVGALSLGARIDRSAHPARWYAGCEAVIGLWSLALLFLMAPVSGWLLGFIGAQTSALMQWSVVFIGTFALLLPATAAMGATLPAMERVVGALRAESRPIAMLYAANTFGAVLGVLASAFVLVPAFGLSFTAALCVATNFLCAVLALKVFAPAVVAAPARASSDSRAVLFVLAATGLLGIGYEVLVVRVLSQVAENTVYTFAILLAVYLTGTALGAAGYSRWAGSFEPARLRDRLLQWLTAACLVGIVCLVFAGQLKSAVLQAMGPSMTTAILAEAALAVTAFLIPTLIMGALFSHLAGEARSSGISFGRAIGVNTLGAALAPVICGVILLPALGSTLTLLLISAGYLLLATPRTWRTPAQWSAATATVALGVWAPSLALIELPEGGRLASYIEGVAATVSVVEDANGVGTLHINNRQQEGSSATLLADARQGLLPILLHPAPRRALFLGIGTGVTSRSAAEDAALQVDAVELLPDVIAASNYFAKAFGEGANPRLRMLTADARRFVRVTNEHYDVIVADNFHPARSGSGALYTVEHFAAVRERLAPAGVFCQWLPLHQLDLGTLRSIVRSYLEVYPHGWAMLATNSLETPVLGLVARRDGEGLRLGELRQRLVTARFSRSLEEFGIGDDLALLGSFIAGPVSLAKFSNGAPLNTDDHPVVTYLAPRITYAPDSLPRDRLLELLGQVQNEPANLLVPGDAEWQRRLAAYWQARDRYLELGRDVRPTFDVREMLAQVREPLLSVLHISPDFRPAYDPLLRMAYGLAPSDSSAARELLTQLVREQPARPEAAEALRALGASP
jgi:spermidine synthase